MREMGVKDVYLVVIMNLKEEPQCFGVSADFTGSGKDSQDQRFLKPVYDTKIVTYWQYSLLVSREKLCPKCLKTAFFFFFL